MRKLRHPLRWFAGAAAALLLVSGVSSVFLSWWAARQIRGLLPPSATVGPVRWSWPLGVTVSDIRIPDPRKNEPYLLRVDRALVRVPLWGALIRPLPVEITFDAPHLKVSSENVDVLIGEMKLKPADWLALPFAGLTDAVDRGDEKALNPLPFLPVAFRAVNATVDVIEPQLRPGRPLFTAGRLDFSLALRSVSLDPTVELSSRGEFITSGGETIGFQEVEIRARPQKRYLEGSIRLRHEHLADFRNLYRYAPRPVFIEGGIADFRIRFTLTGGKHVKMIAATLVQNLDLSGVTEGGVHWPDIMHAVEDDRRIYSWEVPVEGDLDDPAFDPHDYVLSAVEWLMKEKAAGRGLKIPGQMFFYADTPEAPQTKGKPAAQ